MSNPSQRKNWKLYDAAPDSFLANVSEHPLLVQVLYNRGLRTPHEIHNFLSRADAVVENPYKLRDMVPAVKRIVQAIQAGETICVYGDFDADGVCATALTVGALQSGGARVGAYIPDRVDEGYGLNMDAIATIASRAQLMITVDCGIRSVAEVAEANRLGLDVVVTDHHTVGPTLPPAVAVINPRRKDCDSNFQRLAGVGVAYRLTQAVLRALSQHDWHMLTPERAAEIEEELLDLVAIGTVADMMPLLGENRSLVQRGLAQLNATQRPGLVSLIQETELQPGAVDAQAISFRLAPRINAAGRLAHAKVAYELLRTDDPAKGYSLATELDALNQRRRTLTDGAQAEAESQVATQVEAGRMLYVVTSPGFLPGIVGLVAAKLVEAHYRPAVVIEQGEVESRGSARSIEQFDISHALDQVEHLLLRHGGHSRAAGFTVESARLGEFSAALQAAAEEQLAAADNLQPILRIDAVAELDQLNWGLVEQFKRLEPTGQENPPPLLLCRNVRVREARAIGKGKHLRLVVDGDPGSPVLDAVAFRQGEWKKHLAQDDRVDLVCHLEVNEWQGRRRLQLNVQDLRISAE